MAVLPVGLSYLKRIDLRPNNWWQRFFRTTPVIKIATLRETNRESVAESD